MMSESTLQGSDELAQVAASLQRSGFFVAVDRTGESIRLRLQGELDMATAPGLARALDTALDARPTTLAVDLSELTFLDSTGIRVLITASRRAGDQGCAFVLRSPCRPVLKALRLTGVDRLMTVETELGS